MKRLPRSLDEIGGLRAARWIRESTTGQYDRYGPASQREQQDRFIERHGLVDTGLVYKVAQSGTTVWRSPTMAEMLTEARAGAFDLLLAGYSDRWQRNLRRTLELLEDGLHPAGVALVMCDRRILSSDPHDWDELVAEAAGAERYIRRLAERVVDGYSAKFEAHDDQAGNPPLGFRRGTDPPHTIEVDPATIGLAIALFERYAVGTVSIERLAAESGFAADRIRYILRNPLYNGWVRRHRGPAEQRRAAPWRAGPPVSDELFGRVEQVRRSKTRVGDHGTGAGLISWPGSWSASAGAGSARMGSWATRPGLRSSISSRARPGARRPGSAQQPGRSRSWPRLAGFDSTRRSSARSWQRSPARRGR